jgi:hypothetical protein
MSQPPRPVLDLRGRLALRPREAAEALGISERKLRELLPELPCVRRGAVMIPVSMLHDWLLAARVEGERVDAAVAEILDNIGADDESS